MGKISWDQRCCTVAAEMLSHCPAWWDVCEIDPAIPRAEKVVQSLAKVRIGNLDYRNEMLNPTNDYKIRGRLSRAEWQDQRPLCIIMFDPGSMVVRATGTNIMQQSGLVHLLFEKNATNEDGEIIRDLEMPSEQSCQWWQGCVQNIVDELMEITVSNRLPREYPRPDPPPVDVAYPGYRVGFVEAGVIDPATFSTVEYSRVFGPHFGARVYLSTILGR